MVKLADGREIKPNLRKFTISEYRQMFSNERTQEFEDEVVARVYGLTVEELLALDYVDYHAVGKDFFDAVQKPLDNPN